MQVFRAIIYILFTKTASCINMMKYLVLLLPVKDNTMEKMTSTFELDKLQV